MIAPAITAPSAGEQREMILALKSTPSPEVVSRLEQWKEGKNFMHEDADGNITPVLRSGKAAPDKTFATVSLDNGGPMPEPDGATVRINPRLVDFADPSSGLRKAMKEVFEIAVTFVSAASLESGSLDLLDLSKSLAAVKDCRYITKADQPFNDAMPRITVDPDTYTVTADGLELRREPLAVLPVA